MRLFFYILSPFNLRLGYFFCDLLSLIIFVLNTEMVKISRINIKIANQGKNKNEIEDIVKGSIKESIRSYYETLFSLSRSQNTQSKKIFKVENRYLFSQINRDLGLIMLSMHNRSVDLLLNQLTNQEQITAIFKPIKIGFLNDFVRKNRQRSGSKVFETNLKGVKELFSALKKGETIAMAADQVPARGMGIYEEFFGKNVYTTNLIPSLHAKTNAPIISVAMHSDITNGHLYIRYSSKYLYSDNATFDAKAMNKEIETMININQADYNWEYKRFRRQQTEDKNIYK